MEAEGFLRCGVGVLIICLLSMLLLFHCCGLRGFESCWLRWRTEEGDELSNAASFESMLFLTSSGMASFLGFGLVGIIVDVRYDAPGVVIGNDELKV